MAAREQWATRIGFILAAVGSAVGLGNVWRFPFQVGQEGGAAFLLIYILFILLIGIPAMLVEFTIGRRAKRNPINAFEQLGYGRWKFAGAVAVITAFAILSYYVVVAGWVVRYTFSSLTGAYFAEPTEYFLTIADGTGAVLFALLFMILTAGVVAFGIQRGIELAVKVMVPSIILLMLILIIYAFTLAGAGDGYAYYLSPDFDVIAANWTSILPAAAGQALFTLSLGMGIMITYSSYIAEDRNLGEDTGWIVGLDTIIAFMAGLIVFPVLFTIGVAPGEGGAGELFIGVGGAIAGLQFNWLIGFLFFGTVLVAALSSAISILEVSVSYIIDNYDIDRKTATFGIAGAIFILGIPAALDLSTLEFYDGIVDSFLLPLTMFLLVIFVGWVYKEARDELSKGTTSGPADLLPTLWLWHVRTIILIVIAIVLVLNVADLLGIELGL